MFQNFEKKKITSCSIFRFGMNGSSGVVYYKIRLGAYGVVHYNVRLSAYEAIIIHNTIQKFPEVNIYKLILFSYI